MLHGTGNLLDRPPLTPAAGRIIDTAGDGILAG